MEAEKYRSRFGSQGKGKVAPMGDVRHSSDTCSGVGRGAD